MEEEKSTSKPSNNGWQSEVSVQISARFDEHPDVHALIFSQDPLLKEILFSAISSYLKTVEHPASSLQGRSRILREALQIPDDVLVTLARGDDWDQSSRADSSYRGRPTLSERSHLEDEIEGGNTGILSEAFYKFLNSNDFRVNDHIWAKSSAFKYRDPKITGGKNWLFFNSREFSSRFVDHWIKSLESNKDINYIWGLISYKDKIINDCTMKIMHFLRDQGRLIDLNLFYKNKDIDNGIERHLYRVSFGEKTNYSRHYKGIKAMSTMFIMEIDGIPDLEKFTLIPNHDSLLISATPSSPGGFSRKFDEPMVIKYEKNKPDEQAKEDAPLRTVLDVFPPKGGLGSGLEFDGEFAPDQDLLHEPLERSGEKGARYRSGQGRF